MRVAVHWWGLGRCSPSDVVGWSSVNAQEPNKSQESRVSCIHVPSAYAVFLSIPSPPSPFLHKPQDSTFPVVRFQARAQAANLTTATIHGLVQLQRAYRCDNLTKQTSNPCAPEHLSTTVSRVSSEASDFVLRGAFSPRF
jgi:hypothetical protein